MYDPFIGEIRLFAGTFAPKGWLLCNGQGLSMQDKNNTYTALFSLIGTTYGGDGRTKFNVPDLRGRTGIGVGGKLVLGNRLGWIQNFLTTKQMPTHTHTSTTEANAWVSVSDKELKTPAPQGAFLSTQASDDYYGTADSGKAYGPKGTNLIGTPSVLPNGNGEAMENRQPYLVLNYMIAFVGLYPSRS